MVRSVIIATGSHIPEVRVPNEYFLEHDFRGSDQKTLDKKNDEILRQFESITGIRERRYAADHQVTSDLALDSAEKALASSNVDRESLDGIIVAQDRKSTRLNSSHSQISYAVF